MQVTEILEAMEKDQSRADQLRADQLLPLVYDELRRIAAVKLANEKQGQTLQPTELVHEAFLKLVSYPSDGDQRVFNNRRHFFAAAGEAMRRILIDRARRRLAVCHGGEANRVDMNCNDLPAQKLDAESLAVHEVLDRLAKEDPVKADLVKLRYFAGFTNNDAASLLGLSPKSAEKKWLFAKAWLAREISKLNR
jgi:RNA polymerase sigma factor (TIGR02999 family)